MTTKEKIIQVAETLPADATIEEAMERLLFLAKVEKGLQQADNGETVRTWRSERECQHG